MKKESFSKKVKDHLRATPIKKKCCNHAFEDGCGILSGGDTPANLIKKASSALKCSDCLPHFLAGLFICFGNISDPAKSYHMEFSLKDEETADAVSEVLSYAGFDPSETVRKNRFILYFKNSVVIEDLLGIMGASFGAFEIMNAKIIKELREDTNRQVNCDSANITKSVGAAEKHIRIINELIESDRFKVLPEELQTTAELRIKHPGDSLAELGQKFLRPISKSGVKHRLDKIVDFYESKTDKE